jgi:hypothetical protein
MTMVPSSKCAQAVKLMACIPEILGSNVCRNTNYCGWGFRDFFQCPSQIAASPLQLDHNRLFPHSAYFIIHYQSSGATPSSLHWWQLTELNYKQTKK